jgi:hypothetical protein
MIIGEHSHPSDLNVNACRGKKLTNIRAAGRDENVILTPPDRDDPREVPGVDRAGRVGLSETRAFFTREIRRIEALGERLTLHLDNAKLHAELLVKTEALSVERDLRELFLGSGS